jgi:hypothetical protein
MRRDTLRGLAASLERHIGRHSEPEETVMFPAIRAKQDAVSREEMRELCARRFPCRDSRKKGSYPGCDFAQPAQERRTLSLSLTTTRSDPFSKDLLRYSSRKTSIGSTSVARRAGT